MTLAQKCTTIDRAGIDLVAGEKPGTVSIHQFDRPITDKSFTSMNEAIDFAYEYIKGIK
jgi:hypothetical protein